MSKKQLLTIILIKLVLNANDLLSIKTPLFIIFDSQPRIDRTGFLNATKMAGFFPEHISLDQALDCEPKNKFTSDPQVVAFLISIEFLTGLKNGLSTTKKLLSIMNFFYEKNFLKNFLIIFDSSISYTIESMILIKNFFQTIGLNVSEKDILLFFQKSYLWSTPLYETMLFDKPRFFDFISLEFEPWHKIYSKKKEIFLVSGQFIEICGPSQNHRFMPINKDVEWALISKLISFLNQINDKKLKPHAVCKELFIESKTIPTRALSAKNPIIGWMEIEKFCENPNIHSNKAEILTNFILKASLTGLWINLNPNTLFSKNAILKEKASVYIKGLAALAKGLKSKTQKIPDFFLGFEIGNNLTPTKTPIEYEVDIYGNKYQDLPEFLNWSFWQEELIDPLKEFNLRWNEHSEAAIFPIKSIVLDLEFYNTKKRTTFGPLMGFGKLNRSSFSSKKSSLTKDLDRMAQNKEFSLYFDYLEKECFNLGIKLANEVKKIFSHKISLDFYLPNMQFDWIFKNLLAGATKHAPCTLFSFDKNPEIIGSLLKNEKINCSICPALMLHKIKSSDSFKQSIEKNRFFKNGLWFNRFSRIVDQYQPEEWHILEQSPAIESEKEKFLIDVNKYINGSHEKTSNYKNPFYSGLNKEIFFKFFNQNINLSFS